MNESYERKGVTDSETRIEQAEARTEQAEARTEQAETRTEQAKTRAESAETRTEQAETRTELAKTRTEQAEIRTEQVETTLQESVQREAALRRQVSTQTTHEPPLSEPASPRGALQQLTGRQREVLRLIAEGRNTKQIAQDLAISPKTVEYHRVKLMNVLNVHDVPGLVRFALRMGLIPQDG